MREGAVGAFEEGVEWGGGSLILGSKVAVSGASFVSRPFTLTVWAKKGWEQGGWRIAGDVSFCHTHDLCLEQMRLRLHAL